MLVAGASSVVALGIGLLIGAFAIDTSGGNEFAYQARITNEYRMECFQKLSWQFHTFVYNFDIFIKEYDGNAEEFLKNNIDNMSIRSWLG